jgi:isochorismate synthase
MQESVFFDRIDQSIAENIPFVFYRKPQEENVFAIFQNDNLLYTDVELSQKGFVFAAFDDKEKTIIFPSHRCKTYQFSYISKQKSIAKSKKRYPNKEKSLKEQHIQLVQKGIDAVRKGTFSKVVLSRKEDIIFPEESIKMIFKRLLDHYPEAFVYVWFHPVIGLWMGASPEILLKVTDGRFKTMALAGTQSFRGDMNVIWNKKEKQEQQFVTDYILSDLDKDQLIVSKPFTLKAGSLLHICTEIHGEISDKNNIKNLVKRLQPTPAICGLPREESKAFILQYENYDRSFYTGFLGELDPGQNQNTSLFVNLRCMQIDLKAKDKAVLYIGGGITIDSDPVKEWEETVVKSEIMKKVLY